MQRRDELNNPLFQNINNYILDLDQRKAILSDAKNNLIVAGAGSGKTLTIIAKIKYLVEIKKVNPKEILCLSFTNEAVNNLKNRLNYDIDVFTFHKLALNILKDNHVFYQIATSDYLEYTVSEYFEGFLEDNKYLTYIIKYFRYYIKDKDLDIKIIKTKYNKLFSSYKNLIIKFINKIKCNNQTITDFQGYLKRNKWLFSKSLKEKNKDFLIIMFEIYRFYLEEINSACKIDFDMMISLASEVIKKKGMKRYYKYIIIDEYQDISLIRYNLIKTIQEELDSNIFAVGDDFQSIYAFSGSTLELFIKFKKYFKDSKVFYLKNTYRNSEELIKIANYFIHKNPYQLSKKLISSKSLKFPIKIVYFTRSNYQYKFFNLLEYIYSLGIRECLVLGRCNHDINVVLKDKELIYKDMNLRFLTVHSSKGLESEAVIVLNLSDELLGFPNKMEDDALINLCFKNKDKYLYAEERRLFYVALTRTRNYVFLMTNKNKESIFIKEIKYRCEVIDV